MPAAQIDPVQTAREALLATLDSLEPIVTLSHDDLVVIALGSARSRSEAEYLTLADSSESADSAAVQFSELDTGSVPTVQATIGLHPLVVLAGETIVGGKQNRIINVSLWLAAQKTTAIPVSCLESGRWDAGHHFRAGRPVDLGFRAKVSHMVGVQSRAAHSSAQPHYEANQGAVWQEIGVKEHLAERRSPTHALHELYASEDTDLEKAVAAFPMPDDASGLAVGIGGRLVAVDVFDSTDTLRKQWRRLIASAASARLDHRRRVAAGMLPRPEHRDPDPGALGRMLARAKKSTADASVKRSVGEGWDVRLATKRLHGSALVHAGRVVHLALFRDEA